MKMLTKALSILLLVSMLVASLVACGKEPAQDSTTTTTQPIVEVDYAGQVKLDMNSSSLKAEAEVKTFIDGDTTHFYVPTDVAEYGVLKARYLAINTPESTGRIEPFGKTASRFTKEKLKNAVSIIIESDNESWNLDSTGERHMVWVWYKATETSEYRNLNIEILQNGLALPSNASQNRYGDTCVAALTQAKAVKHYVHSGQADPEMYAGDAIELTLRELRTNIAEYDGKVVVFEAGVVMNTGDNSVFVESYDEETGLYFGMFVYYGFSLSGTGIRVLKVGNLVRLVGTVQYYEAGGTYQLSDLRYDDMDPDKATNIQKIGDGYQGAFPLTAVEDFANGTVVIEDEEGNKETFDFAELTLNSSISFENLKVTRVSTTTNPASSSKGAMTLYCENEDGVRIQIRTTVFKNEDGSMITADAYNGKTINVRGFVEYYLPEGQTEGLYQIKVLTPDQITIVEN